MLKKTITYTDYNGVERTEDFYFNISKAEAMQLELTTNGGYAEMIKRVIDAKDGATIVNVFKEFVLKAYGEKSPDGKYFYKVDENGNPGNPLSKKFEQTEAYSELYMELALNAGAAAAFVNAVLPNDISAKENTAS